MKEHPEASIDDVFNCILDESRISLANTPELLPVLKEVGVVDSGGTGLVVILEGFKAAMDGHPFVMEEKESTTAKAAMELENEEFGYCTEFILRLSEQGQVTFCLLYTSRRTHKPEKPENTKQSRSDNP